MQMSYKPPPKELPPGSYVIAYLRDSGGDKQEKSTLDQRNEITAYCKKYDLILTEIFEDAARSGTSTAKRDDFERMIDLCREDKTIQGLLVWSFSRLARNTNDAMYFKSDLRRRGIIVHSITDEIPEGPYSNLVEVMIDTANEEKSRQTSRDTKRGLAQRTLAGFVPSGGTPPRGYRAVREIISSHRDGSPRIGTKWEVDPETGPLVTMAFQMRAQSRSVNEIIKAPCGILYKTKGCWTTFFRNLSYTGIGKCGDTEVPDHHPALVDPETWQAVQLIQEKLSKRAAGNLLHAKRYNSPSLLSGLAVCIHCGTPIIRSVSGARSSKNKKWVSYLCGKKRNSKWESCEGKQIQAERADSAVIDTVLNSILTKDFVNETINQIRDKLSDNADAERQEQATRLALANCEKTISRLLDTIESTDSSMAKERLKDRENGRALLQFEIKIQESRRQAVELQITPEAMEFTLNVWRGDIEAARDQNDVRELRILLRQFITKIELGYGIARLWYTIPISAFSENETRLKQSLVGTASLMTCFEKALIIQWSKADD